MEGAGVVGLRRRGEGVGELVGPEGVDGEGLRDAEGGEVGVGPGAVGVAGEGGEVALGGVGGSVRGAFFVFLLCERERRDMGI